MKISVLYVDDEPALLNLGKVFLERSGFFSVTTAESVPQALSVLHANTIDAIVSDYQMPDTDGIAFLRKIRESSDIPFILFTGRGREEVVIDAINNGVDFYLQKGGDVRAQFAELGHKIIQATTRSNAEHALRRHIELIRRTAEVSARFIDLPGEKVDEAIRQTLGEIGLFSKADRCYVAEILPDAAHAKITFEWIGHGIEPVQQKLGEIDIHEISWLIRQLSSGEPLSIPRVIDIPSATPEAAAEKKRLMDQGIKSLLLLPLMRGDRTFRLLGLDAVRRELSWTEEDVDVLRIYGQIIMGALARKHADIILKKSEELYRTVFESTGTAMMILGEDRRILAANRGMEFISGYSREELTGNMEWTQFVSDEDLPRLKEYHRQRRIDPAPVPRNYAFRFRRKSGSFLDTFITVEMIPGTGHSVVSIIDVTDLKNTQAALLESEEKFRCLSESMTVGIYMIQDLRFVYTNPAFSRMFGYSSREIKEMPTFLPFFAEEDQQKVLERAGRRLAGFTDADRYFAWGRTKSGELIRLEIHGATTQYIGRPAIIGTMIGTR